MYCEKGNIIRIVRLDILPQKEEDFKQWYAMEHERLLLKVPGVIWTYRGIAANRGFSKYLYLYLYETAEVYELDQYIAASTTNWANRLKPFFQNLKSDNYEVIIPGEIPTQVDHKTIISLKEIELKTGANEDVYEKVFNRSAEELKNSPEVMTFWLGKKLNAKDHEYITMLLLKDQDTNEMETCKEIIEDISDKSELVKIGYSYEYKSQS